MTQVEITQGPQAGKGPLELKAGIKKKKKKKAHTAQGGEWSGQACGPAGDAFRESAAPTAVRLVLQGTGPRRLPHTFGSYVYHVHFRASVEQETPLCPTWVSVTHVPVNRLLALGFRL